MELSFMSAQPRFADHVYVKRVRAAIKLLENGDEGVAEELLKATGKKTHRSSVVRWRQGQIRIPLDLVSTLARILKLENASTPEEIEHHYGAYWTLEHGQEPEKKAGGVEAQAFESALEALNLKEVLPRAGERDRAAAERADNALANLWNQMDVVHFIAVTTQTKMPGGLEMVSYPQFASAINGAMKRGALTAFIIPSQARLKTLKKNYKFGQQVLELTSIQEFREGFRLAWNSYKQFLFQECNVNDKLSDMVAMRMLLFEWDGDFPMTPCGRTISLIGKSRRYPWGSHRILERGALGRDTLALVPETPPTETMLEKFIIKVINDKNRKIYVPDHEECNKESINWFLQELNKRMRTRGEPSPGPYYSELLK
jgi:hypothetical protein